MSIDEHRKKINEVDAKIIELINERAKEVKAIGELKNSSGDSIYKPEREQEILRRIDEMSEGKAFPKEAMRIVFREIISASRNLEKEIKAAFLGPEASFTHIAAIKQFGSSTNFIAMKSISDVFKEVEVDKYDYGVVPIENSNEGVVNYTMDMFINSSLKICSENYVSIQHNLLSHCGDLSAIKKVYSHPQALAQCRLWLNNNLPQAELLETKSTAEAAQVVAWDKYSAAIASLVARDKYNLNLLAEHIEDNPENYTRFLIIGKEDCGISKEDKTSLIVAVKDEPGSLEKILSIISNAKINMNKIESRPTKKKAWEYLFYIDIDGHRKDERIAQTLEALKKHTTFFKVLGSYPKIKLF